jgi:N-methylhydantoinase B
MRKVNPITLEVVRNALVAYCDEMATALCRTAYNMMIFEVRDYCIGIVDAAGNLIAQNTGGLPIFLADLGTAVRGAIEEYGPDGFAPGDVLVSNDPRRCGQHLNNVVVFTPVFFAGKLVAFPALRAHWVDVGGGSRGFGSTSSRDIYQEGLQLCGLKLYKAGEPNEELLRLFRDNIRFPEASFGDLRGQIAGCRLGEKRLNSLFEKYGQTVLDCIHEMWDESELLARKAIAALPDGEYEAESFIDNDLVDQERTLAIKVKVVVHGDEMTIDFSGLPPQARGPINAGMSGGVAAARVAYKMLVAPKGIVNEGEFRPLRVVLPPGTILSAQHPAPLAFWSSSLPTVVDTTLRAMSNLLPERIPAGHKGDMGGIAIFGQDERRGGRRFVCTDIFGGGFGAKASSDGVNAVVSICQGAVRNAPVEVQEAYYPIFVEAHRLRPDSGGAGRSRGGLGIEFVITSPQEIFVNTLLQRTKMPPWGLHGGQDALPMGGVVETMEGERIPVRQLDSYRVRPGDRVVMWEGGGGGWGPAEERPTETVRQDVAQGYVSREAARVQYGVVLNEDLTVDAVATTGLRAEMARATAASRGGRP